MKTRSRDTHPDIERVQIDLLRKAGIARRATLMRSISGTVMSLARRAIREANPDASEEELAIIFAEVHYGPELASGLREHFSKPRNAFP